MGCGGSKADDLPLVTLCRERKELIKTASHHRYALAAAHLAYFQSLRDVGEAIHRFVDEELVIASSSSLSPGSPVLTLPSDEGKPAKNPKFSSSSTSISHSVHEESDDHKHGEEGSEGSHLHLSAGSGSESGSEAESGHIHIDPNPQREEESFPVTYPPGYGYPIGGWGFPVDNLGMYYMKRSAQPARSATYQEPENHRVDPGFGYPSYYPTPEYQNAGFFGFAPPPESRAPPPPPTPPSPPPPSSSWDFLNVFDTYDYGGGVYPGYYGQSGLGFASNSSSPDSREVRQREGIPDLEEETEHEAVREAYKETMTRKKKKKKKLAEYEEVPEVEMDRRYSGEGTSGSAVPVQNNSDVSSSSTVELSPLTTSDEGGDFASANGKEGKSNDSSGRRETMVAKSSEEEYGRKKGVSFEVEDTNAASTNFDVESSKFSSLTALSVHGTRDLREVVQEIKQEFDVASGYGKEVALLLEVNQLPYQQKGTGIKEIFSRIMYLVAPSMLSSRSSRHPPLRLSSRTLKMAKTYNGHSGQDTGNLSSTLDKLYVWEKKLYKEVKDEEKLRVLYEEKVKKLTRLNYEGAEPSKIVATQASIGKLMTKIDICIRSVDSISSRIHRLRDAELEPQLTQLIHGLIRMWRSMFRCHQKQFQAIMESKVRSLKANTGLRRDSGLKATLDLEMELRDWSTRFNNWISTQRAYVEALNGWLTRCLHKEPEQTADGPAPFSPGRAGAPPVFVICSDWHEAMLRISASDVEDAMQGFASSLHELWERQDEEQRQRVKAEYISHDFEKRLNALRAQTQHDPDDASEKTAVTKTGVSPLDDLKVDLDSMRKKLAEERARHKEAIKLVHTAASSSLQAGLVPIFKALGHFTADVVKAHEQVRLQHAQSS